MTQRSLLAAAAAALSLVVAATASFLSAGTPEAAAQAQTPPATEDEKTIYALGVSLAQNLAPFTLSDAELQQLFAGIRDATRDRELQVEMDTYGPKIRELAQARAARLAEAEREAGRAFLEAEAAAEGAQTMESGLVKRVIQPGSGARPSATDTVKVHYHGTLRSGEVFDSSIERGEPASFPLGRVIPCWTEALQTMQVGEKAHITCPPDIAYGDRGAPPRIPPGATLAFDVELLEIVQPGAAAPHPPPGG